MNSHNQLNWDLGGGEALIFSYQHYGKVVMLKHVSMIPISVLELKFNYLHLEILILT